MKRLNILLICVLLSSAFFTSCSEGIGDDVIVGSDYTDSPVLVGWANPSVTESYFSDIGILENLYPISIVGGGDGSPTTSDITVTLSVDTANSTAVEGNEFTFPSSTVTIPAGSNIALVPINVNTGAFSPTLPTQVIITATASSEGVSVSEPQKKLVMNFVGCKSDLANYTYLMTLEGRGRTYGPVLETIREVSVNSFVTYSVGYWGGAPFNIGNGVRFSDICGTLTIPVQDLAAYYSNEVGPLGTATVDENGNFTLNYYISLSGVNEPMKAVYIRQ